jgi:ATP-binding cassette subfamily F protein 3
VLLETASMVVHPGHKVGLVGPNGAGKTSLFAIVRGELHADAGEVEMPPRWVMAYVAQETPAVESPALEFVIDGDEGLREIENAIALGEAEHLDGEKLALLHAQYDEIGGYQARSRAQALLGGLGFSTEAQAKPVSQFSGGWRMRLNLARALMCRSDLLLLDEPTNHLDLDAVLWLEDWLKAYTGAVLLITHDREFLDAVVDSIVHIEAKKLNAYLGNYSAFEAQRAARLALQQASYEKQQKSIAHLEAFITRFRAKASKATQAQSRIKALEKLERIAAAHVDAPFNFRFREPLDKPRQLVRLEEAVIGYGERPVLEAVDWSLIWGDAIGLLGPNGAGKSTLLKTVIGQLPLMGGKVERAQGLRVGYFAQHQVDQLRLEENALWHLGRLASGEREQVLRDFLGGFDFRGDQVTQAVASFSGGEKARLALALIVWQRPNLLVLDEPTNHLDLEMRESLAQSLIDFEGALVVVAHDRALLAAATDTWYLVADGRVVPFAGDLDDYRQWARDYHARAGQREERGGGDRKAQRRQEAEARARTAGARKPFEKKIQAIETELEGLQKRNAELQAWLASDEAYAEANRDRLQDVLRQSGEAASRIAVLEEDWLWNQAALETEVNRPRD